MRAVPLTSLGLAAFLLGCEPAAAPLEPGIELTPQLGKVTIDQAAPDPCPTCAGVYLSRGGNTWNDCVVRLSYGDVDVDGVDDACESEVAIAFAPELWIHPNDGDARRESYFAARKSIYGYDRALDVMYMLGYYRDTGTRIYPGVTLYDHNGDSEFIELVVQFDPSTGRWYLLEGVYSAHYKTPNNKTKLYIWNELSYPGGINRRNPIAFVSKDKHANYNSVGTCDNWESGDDCTGVQNAGKVYVDFYRNVGTYHHPMKDCVTSVNGQPGLECFWDRAWTTFAGWQGSGGDRPYWDILQSFFWSP